MFISDNKVKRQKTIKTVEAYVGISLFCGIFSIIYEYYGHGVYSNYMVYMFLFPLIGGVFPYAAIGFIKKIPFPGKIALNLYNSGIATLTVGSGFRGILDIYGTTSGYIVVYWIAGIVLVILGIAAYTFSITRQSHNI